VVVFHKHRYEHAQRPKFQSVVVTTKLQITQYLAAFTSPYEKACINCIVPRKKWSKHSREQQLILSFSVLTLITEFRIYEICLALKKRINICRKSLGISSTPSFCKYLFLLILVLISGE